MNTEQNATKSDRARRAWLLPPRRPSPAPRAAGPTARRSSGGAVRSARACPARLLPSPQKLQQTEQSEQQHRSAVTMLEGQIQALQNQITEHTSCDLSATETKLTALQLSRSTIEGQITQITTRTQRNQEALTQLSRFRKELPAIEERWIQVKTLADTTGGTLSGKEKIMLETYVQMTYFDRILVRANSRLLVMSRGQYELQRCISSGSNRRQTGLELDVIDHFNGTTRSVKTLSGGESFQAALSLALGLSDEVQSLAGGIHLDNSRQERNISRC